MKPTQTVLIGIQARSTSTRLPNKVHLELDGKPILQHVLDRCNEAAKYLDRQFKNRGISVSCKTAILTPINDPIVQLYKPSTTVYEGDEKDVLSRYCEAAGYESADYVVRVTADCAFLASHVISRCVKMALTYQTDYTSNVLHRTFMEGYDTEVISKRLLFWLNQNAKDPSDREHVTTLIAKKLRERRFPFIGINGRPRVHHVLNDYDFSDIRTSIDTPDDYEVAKKRANQLRVKRNEASLTGSV